MRGFRQAKGRLFAPVVACALLALAAAIPAGAYFTTSGSGTGAVAVISSLTIVQAAPFGGSVSTAKSGAFSDQLATNASGVTFKVTSPNASLSVSSAGVVTTTSMLAVGTYSISGTDSDTFGGTGYWGYTLKVTTTPIVQTAPFGNSATTAESGSFSDQLATSGSAVTFNATANTSLSVSSAGVVTTTGPLSVGTYTISGTDSDSLGDAGAWTYTLTVSVAAITQVAPFGKSVSTTASSAFSDDLATNGSGVIFNAVANADLSVSSSGKVTTPGALAVGDYSISGTDSDSLGDTGTWSYTLTVTAVPITQDAPFGASVTAGSGYSSQLATSDTSAVFSPESAGTHLSVASSGAVTAPTTDPVGTYTVSGTDSDSLGDSGSWSFTLSVTAASTLTITQDAPFGASVTAGSGYSGELATSDASATFSPESSGTDLSVTSSGAVTAPTTDPVGTYTVSGTDSDSGTGATGSWSFTLTVAAVPIIQTAPFGSSVSTAASTDFTDHLVTNGTGVSFKVTSPNTSLSVSGSGAITTVGGPLSVGRYTSSGSDSDALGDTGTWSYTLTVTAVPITQSAPFGDSVSTAASTAFTDDLATNGNGVSFKVTSPNAHLLAASSGVVTTTGPLSVGTYTISGTDSDTLGDTGTWSYTLSVTAAAITQTAPFGNSVSTAGSAAFTGQLATNGSGVSFGAVTNAHLSVTSAGVVSTTGLLAVGDYSISGTDSDSLGDTGSWSYTLSVTAAAITQIAPFNGSVTTAGSTVFTDHLATNGTGVAFKPVSTASLRVSSAGVVTTTGKLAAGTYSISGTDSNKLGARGTWSFTLVVTASAPTGGPPIVARVVPHVTIAAVGPWTLFANKQVHFRIHLYGSRGKVSGVVRLLYGRRTLCARLLVNGLDHCTVSSAKIGHGRRWLTVAYAGSGFYKGRSFRRNVYVH